jgi:hypothetical protein
MLTLIAILLLWSPWAATRLIRAWRAHAPDRVHLAPTGVDRSTPSATVRSPDQSQVWSALDDRQLTRLLTDSAPTPSPPGDQDRETT